MFGSAVTGFGYIATPSLRAARWLLWPISSNWRPARHANFYSYVIPVRLAKNSLSVIHRLTLCRSLCSTPQNASP